jgi:MtaA/CmuA family methyltransferase
MNSYERYIGMVKGEKVDCIPRIPILMHFAADHIGASYADFARDHKVMCKANIALVNDYRIDQLDVMSDAYRETSAWGGKITYHETTTPHCTAPLADRKDLSLLVTPDIYKSKRLVNALDGIDIYKKYGYKKYSITGWVEGPAAEAADVRGVENFLMDIIADESFACEVMDKCLAFAIDFAKVQIEHGCDTIGVGDAIVSQVGPDLYERLILPREKILVEEIQKAGGLVRMHICGDTTKLLPGLTSLGLDVIDIDWQVDIIDARKILGPNVTIAGNLDPVEDILRSTPDKIHEGFKRIYDQIGNPYFVNGGCEIPRGTPVENLIALCEPIEAK